MTETNPMKPTVAIAIVTWNSADEIRKCLKPLQALPENWEVWVADNDSKDETVEIVKSEFPRVNLIDNKANLGFAEGCNQIINRTRTDFVLLLNPDAIADAETLNAMVTEFAPQKEVGAWAIKILYEDGRLQPNCFAFPTLRKNTIDNLGLYRFFGAKWREDVLFSDFFDHESEKNVDWLKGAFVLLRREVLDVIKGVPEDYFMFAEDLDLCWQIQKAGYKVAYNPKFTVIHLANQSAGKLPSQWRVERTTLSKYAFCFKNFGALQTRLIQLTDFVGVTAGIWNLSLRKSESNQINIWKMDRKFIWKALKSSRSDLTKILHTR